MLTIEQAFDYLEDNFFLNGMEYDLMGDLEDFESLEEVVLKLEDICAYGCQSGIVSFLVYNYDVYNYFKEHMHDIATVIHEYGEVTGESIPMDGFTITKLTWLGYEIMVSNFLSKLYDIIEHFGE